MANKERDEYQRDSRWLRQGDPLSPFTFTIMVEAPSALLSKAKECWQEVVVLKRILRRFELCSGLKINLSKSLMVGVGSTDEEI